MKQGFKKVRSVCCQHIADFYLEQWKDKPNLANKLLMVGYAQWARGLIEIPINNLYGFRRK